jgi:hypothetical protein
VPAEEDFLRRQSKKAAMPRSARPPITPPTIPPIAPPDRPESSLDGAVDGEEVADAELDAGAEDVGDAPGVVDVSAKSAVRSIVMEVARGEADERDV